jgi:hypothetical protein
LLVIVLIGSIYVIRLNTPAERKGGSGGPDHLPFPPNEAALPERNPPGTGRIFSICL